MNKDNPVFKKVDMFENGKLSEKFYINNKEVDEKTYYTLLEDRYMNSGVKETPNNKKPTRTLKNKKRQKSEEQKQYEYLSNIVDIINSVDMDKAVNLLASELILQYRIGYYVAQIKICDDLAKQMKYNASVARKSLNELLNSYNIN